MKIKKKTYFQVFRPIFFFIYHFWMGFCWKRKKSPKIYCNITSFLIIKAKKLFLIPCEISENVLLPMHCAPPPSLLLPSAKSLFTRTTVLCVSHRTPFNASKGLRACSQEWKNKKEPELSLLFVKICGLHNKF